MSAAVAILPTRITVDDAWERYRTLLAPVIETPEKLLDREYAERIARAEFEWKEVYAAWLSRSA